MVVESGIAFGVLLPNFNSEHDLKKILGQYKYKNGSRIGHSLRRLVTKFQF